MPGAKQKEKGRSGERAGESCSDDGFVRGSRLSAMPTIRARGKKSARVVEEDI